MPELYYSKGFGPFSVKEGTDSEYILVFRYHENLACRKRVGKGLCENGGIVAEIRPFLKFPISAVQFVRQVSSHSN